MVIPLKSNPLPEGNNDSSTEMKDLNEEQIELTEGVNKEQTKNGKKEKNYQVENVKEVQVEIVESLIKEETRSEEKQQTEQADSVKEEQIELAESVQEASFTTKYDLCRFLCDFICCCCSGFQEGDLDVGKVNVQLEPVVYRGVVARKDLYCNESPGDDVGTSIGNDHSDGSHFAYSTCDYNDGHFDLESERFENSTLLK